MSIQKFMSPKLFERRRKILCDVFLKLTPFPAEVVALIINDYLINYEEWEYIMQRVIQERDKCKGIMKSLETLDAAWKFGEKYGGRSPGVTGYWDSKCPEALYGKRYLMVEATHLKPIMHDLLAVYEDTPWLIGIRVQRTMWDTYQDVKNFVNNILYPTDKNRHQLFVDKVARWEAYEKIKKQGKKIKKCQVFIDAEMLFLTVCLDEDLMCLE